jgi:hypothetical protein
VAKAETTVDALSKARDWARNRSFDDVLPAKPDDGERLPTDEQVERELHRVLCLNAHRPDDDPYGPDWIGRERCISVFSKDLTPEYPFDDATRCIGEADHPGKHGGGVYSWHATPEQSDAANRQRLLRFMSTATVVSLDDLPAAAHPEKEARAAAMTPEQIAEPLSAAGFIGHKPLPDGRCEHRWRNRTTHIVRCRYADGWHAGQVAALLAAIPAKPDDGLDVERLARAMHLARRLPDMEEPYCDNPMTADDLHGHMDWAEAILHAYSMLPSYGSSTDG